MILNIFLIFSLFICPVISTEELPKHPHSFLCADQKKHSLLLYYTSYCPYSKKVLNYLHRIYKKIPMKNLENNEDAKEELKRIGGKMQVPCLIIDGKALYDSDAIIEWLSTHKDELTSESE